MTQTTWKQDILKLSFRTAEALAHLTKGGQQKPKHKEEYLRRNVSPEFQAA
jgi:hypothetical protein